MLMGIQIDASAGHSNITFKAILRYMQEPIFLRPEFCDTEMEIAKMSGLDFFFFFCFTAEYSQLSWRRDKLLTGKQSYNKNLRGIHMLLA